MTEFVKEVQLIMKRAGLILIFLASFGIAFAQKGNVEYSIDQKLAQMSTQEKLGYLFFLEVYGNGNLKHFNVIKRQLRFAQPSGIIFKNGTPEKLQELIKEFNPISENGLLFGASMDMQSLPSPVTLASVGDEALLEEMIAHASLPLKRIGIDLISAPLLEESHPSFYELGQAIAKGGSKQGLTPIFTTERLVKSEVNPSLLHVPGKDPIIDRRTVNLITMPVANIRRSGHEGLVISDAHWEGSQLTEAERVYYQLIAGADIIQGVKEPEQVIEFLAAAIRKGRLKEVQINEKVRKVLKLKYSNQIVEGVRGRFSDLLIEDVYRSSVSLNKNTNNLLPFHLLDTLDIAYVNMGDVSDHFGDMLSKYTRVVEYNWTPEEFDRISQHNVVIVTAKGELTDEDTKTLQLLSQSLKIVLVHFEPLSIIQDYFAESLITVPEYNEQTLHFTPQLIFGAFPFQGVYSGKSLPVGAERCIATEAMGRLAYTSPSRVGMNPDILKGIDDIAKEAISKGAAPGLQVLVARKGQVIYQKPYGYYTYDQRISVSNQTIYDLASVTKVLSTLQTVQFMSERNIIDLNKPLSHYLPELKGTNKQNLVIKDILLHQAGLRPWMPFWRQTMTDEEPDPELYSTEKEESFPLQVSPGLYTSGALKDSVWNWIIDSRLMKKRGSGPYGYRYSDMGFYMMQQLAERMLNQPINEFVAQNLYEPLGMTTTGYLPLSRFSVENIAPTAEDPYFRKQLIKGVVHDEGAAMFGGVAGHSGLFSNANDLAKLLQMHLQEGQFGNQVFLSGNTIHQFSGKQVKDNRRGLGWDKPVPGEKKSPTSIYASEQTYGHTGFTGTAVWVDPKYDLIYIFLSNRIHPDAENGKLMSLDIRSRIQDVIYQSILEFEQKEKMNLSQQP